MDIWLALLGLLAFAVIVARLIRLIARDGLGSNPLPRSHGDELGSWADRELGR